MRTVVSGPTGLPAGAAQGAFNQGDSPRASSGTPRYREFDVDRERRHITKVFKALSDNTRRQILQLLEERQHNVGEIVGKFQLSQPTISRHLSVLKEAELVVDQRYGQTVVYRINDQTLSSSMLGFFSQFRSCSQALA